MKREIKFRAWDNGRMIYLENSGYCMKTLYFTAQEWNDTGTCANGNRVPETVMQFTGLRDKNGKEIYEGDILKGYSEKNWEVKIVNGCACCIGKFPRPTIPEHNAVPLYYWNDEVEIIGSIFQNPELLDSNAPGKQQSNP